MSRWVPELALGALALALATLLVVPWRERSVPAGTGEEEQATPVLPAEPPVVGAPIAAPRQLAALFGWREAKAPPAAPAAVAASPAEETTWLQAIGYVVEQNGTPSYLFKDTRARAVFSLKAGTTNKGWKLVEVRERDFLLEFGGKPYILKRKP